MKKALAFSLLIIVILILVPLLKANIPKKAQVSNEASAKTIKKSDSDNNLNPEDNVLSLAASYVDDSFSDEGLKAVMCIIKNNCICEEANNTHKDTTTAKEYSDEFYQRLKKLYKETKATLYYKNERVYIPLSELSAGYTEYSEDYPYIIKVASPWDCEQEDFVYGKVYEPGISTKGLDKLCSQGTTYTEALRWYLPLLEIKT